MDDGSVSACVYDIAKISEAKTQFVMGIAVAVFGYAAMGWTMPMIILSVTLPLQLLDHKALLIHLRGHTYERPWAMANADSSLKQWMAAKQEEAVEVVSKRKAK
uniref:Uncharacterized protein n=1 Tax=Haptolina brevifila TaxID=156173 RepID=A0A7S2C6D7_9EUKA|mmetsp:Transcript_20930/g.42473  ORF Transcript_20930/g.42473 Transcript_20930/m.42473 type:complete len:104 (+) Transcript_20930:1-312(+)